jgi:hypothetical protein
MAKEAANPKAREFETILARIRDVVAASVLTDGGGEILEIHVLARQRRSAKQIMRDVESTLLSRYGRSIDLRKITVAQIKSESEAALLPMRLVLEGVSFQAAGAINEVKVMLRDDDNVSEGVVSGPASSGGRLRLVAAATLAAVESYFKSTGAFAVDDVAIVSLGPGRAALVCIAALGGRERVLIGSSQVRRDEFEAVARATLDALNRQLDLMVRHQAWTGGGSPLPGSEPSGAKLPET